MGEGFRLSRVGFLIKLHFEPLRHEEKHEEELKIRFSCPETFCLVPKLIVWSVFNREADPILTLSSCPSWFMSLVITSKNLPLKGVGVRIKRTAF